MWTLPTWDDEMDGMDGKGVSYGGEVALELKSICGFIRTTRVLE